MQKMPYRSPRLVDYGPLSSLTLGSSKPDDDGGGKKTKKMP